MPIPRFPQPPLNYAMLHDDTLSGEFRTILNFDNIFGDLIQGGGGVTFDYYVRSDGTAVKGDATGPESDPSACMNEATFNAGGFVAGETIGISGFGASPFSLLTIGDSGASGNKINYLGLNSPVISVASSDYCLEVTTGVDWIYIKDLTLTNTNTASGNNACLGFTGAVGVADNESVVVEDVTVTGNPQGDCFSQVSSGSGHIHYINTIGNNAGTSDRGLSHQAWTLHEAAQTAVADGGSSEGCNFGVVIVNGSMILNNVTITDAYIYCVNTGSGGNVTFNNSSLTSDNATGELFDNSGNGTASLTFNDCALSMTGTSTSIVTVRSGPPVEINGGTITSTGTANSHIIQTLSGGLFSITGADISFANTTNSLRCNTGGTMNIKGNTFDCSADAGSTVYYQGGAAGGQCTGNVFKDFDGQTTAVWILAGNTEVLEVCNNVFWNTSSGGQAVTNAVVASGPVVENNIFENAAISIFNSGGAVIDYNCYFNSRDEGGANSITSDPEFVDSSSGDFRLVSATSPCDETGTDWGIVAAGAVDFNGTAFDSVNPPMGAWQK